MGSEGADGIEPAKFLGEFQHTLDAKGRVILPSSFRDHLTEGLTMTLGQENCLTVYPPDEWVRVLAHLRAMRPTEARERQFVRMMTSQAHPHALDRQGRVTVPARLREYADLTKEVTVVGKDNIIELWNAEAWDLYREEAMDEFSKTDQAFGVGGGF